MIVIRFIFLGLIALVSVVIVSQLMKFFNQKKLDKVWDEDEPIEIQEKKVITLAAKSGGKTTVPEICMKTNLSVDQAQNVLKSLHEKQVMNIQLTDNGSKVYALADLADDQEKQNAIGL